MSQYNYLLNLNSKFLEDQNVQETLAALGKDYIRRLNLLGSSKKELYVHKEIVH